MSAVDEAPDLPLAERVSWSRCARETANFREWRLTEDGQGRLVFVPTLGSRLFSGLFGSMGLVAAGVCGAQLLQGGERGLLVLLVMGLGFVGLGVWLHRRMRGRQVIYDPYRKVLFRGRVEAHASLPEDDSRVFPAGEIAGIQYLGREGAEHGELNLVRPDAARVNLFCHAGMQLAEEGRRLADALGVPFLDPRERGESKGSARG